MNVPLPSIYHSKILGFRSRSQVCSTPGSAARKAPDAATQPSTERLAAVLAPLFFMLERCLQEIAVTCREE